MLVPLALRSPGSIPESISSRSTTNVYCHVYPEETLDIRSRFHHMPVARHMLSARFVPGSENSDPVNVPDHLAVI